ncbi:MAG: FAD:protein FMN transferase [Mangrovibacterium sp.]
MKRIIPMCLLFFALLASSCQKQNYIQTSFSVFGTLSNITYKSPKGVDLQNGIDSVLSRVTESLSPFAENSIVAKINSNQPTPLNDYFTEVYLESKRISVLTSGAYDVTVAPLVNEWGFGFKKAPSEHVQSRIDSIMEFVGFDKVALMNDSISKQDSRTMLDFSSIAKGFAVDKVAQYLYEQGCESFLVDIGGEIKTEGLNPQGELWRVGVSKPTDDSVQNQEIQEILSISGMAMATSGNYRNFYLKDGKRYVHTIDPRLGIPVQSELLSVTIISKSCMQADALATACMVMGLEQSIELIEKIVGIEGYFIYGDDNNKFAIYYTDGFKSYIQ